MDIVQLVEQPHALHAAEEVATIATVHRTILIHHTLHIVALVVVVAEEAVNRFGHVPVLQFIIHLLRLSHLHQYVKM